MENASKALIMAAGILVGVMILTIAVTLFKTFSDFGNETYEKVEAERLAQWNNTYLKYQGLSTKKVNGHTVTVPLYPATAHDIITLANHARENNKKYELPMPYSSKKADETTFYVQVCIENDSRYRNMENLSQEKKEEFLRDNSITEDNGNKVKYYKCTSRIDEMISNTTKRVTYIQFKAFDVSDYQNFSASEDD